MFSRKQTLITPWREAIFGQQQSFAADLEMIDADHHCVNQVCSY